MIELKEEREKQQDSRQVFIREISELPALDSDSSYIEELNDIFDRFFHHFSSSEHTKKLDFNVKKPLNQKKTTFRLL